MEIPDLSAELQKIYDSESNVRISWLWDGGIDVSLGDDLGGYLLVLSIRAESCVGSDPNLKGGFRAAPRTGCFDRQHAHKWGDVDIAAQTVTGILSVLEAAP